MAAPQGEADFCVIGLVFRAKAGNGLYPFSQLSSVLVDQRKSKEWVFADATVLCHLLLAVMVNPTGFLNTEADGEPLGHVTFELFADKVPKTLENVHEHLREGLKYKIFNYKYN